MRSWRWPAGFYMLPQLEICWSVNNKGPSRRRMDSTQLNLPQSQKELLYHVGHGRSANHHDDSVPEGCGVLVTDELQHRVGQDFLLEVIGLGIVGKVYARVVQRDQCHYR